LVLLFEDIFATEEIHDVLILVMVVPVLYGLFILLHHVVALKRRITMWPRYRLVVCVNYVGIENNKEDVTYQ